MAAPAQQGFIAEHLAAAQVHDGLEVRLEFVAQDRAAQVDLQVEQLQCFLVQALVEDLETVPPVRLGAIHGHVGVTQEFLGLAIACVAQGDADAGRSEQLLAVDMHRFAQRLYDALRGMAGILG